MAGNRFDYRQPWFRLVVFPLLLLNFWFDYHHPFGILLDVVIVIFFVSRSGT
jgi:hypothetical protein